MSELTFIVESTLQALAAGLALGSIYGLMCIGLAVIFGIMRVINFAQGEFLMLGMYFAFYALIGTGLKAWIGGAAGSYIAVLGTAPVFYALGMLIHRTLMTRVSGIKVLGTDDEGQSAQLVLTLGLSLILQNGALIVFGSMPRGMGSPLASAAWEISLGDASSIFINQARGVAGLCAIVVTIALAYFMSRARLGKALRAAADNPVAATYMGIDVARCHRIAFGLGTALTAVAGALVATYYPLQPYVGLEFVVIMYAGVVLGGMDSIKGAFWGGLLIGVVQQMSALVLPTQLQTAAIFVIFLLVVFFRPQGLFGRVSDRA